MAYRDPAAAVLESPEGFAEKDRVCDNCASKVGQGEGGKPGALAGVCSNCGTPFVVRMKLRSGEVVDGRYRVIGELAYGAQGWIYLAQDHNASDRWVVLKQTIETRDTTAMATAASETRLLTALDHPNIVKIHDFVQHMDPQAGYAAGYVVMEYVGGQSLRQLTLAHHREVQRAAPLPIEQIIAYGLEILPAIGYLHSQNLLYSDLKPDNVIQAHKQLKLIDLGAVRRIDDYESPLYFTRGYSAPELATEGASIATDLYTIGRTLAVLSFEFNGYTTKFTATLPDPDTVPLFTAFNSYYRFLKRATHADPERRFVSAEEMADQLLGVLREVVALTAHRPRPGPSTKFSSAHPFGVQVSLRPPALKEVVRALPDARLDIDDSATGTALDPTEAIDAPSGDPGESIEARLRIVRTRIKAGELIDAQRQLQIAHDLAIAAGPHDWRIDWYRGLIELAGGRLHVAHAAFDAVYDSLPGEIAPKLALAVTAELQSEYFAAAKLYDLVWKNNHSYISAAFGLARSQHQLGNRGGAINALSSISPATRSFSTAEQMIDELRAKDSSSASEALNVTSALASPRNSKWTTFVLGLVESLAPNLGRQRRRLPPARERLEARLHQRYRQLGPPQLDQFRSQMGRLGTGDN